MSARQIKALLSSASPAGAVYAALNEEVYGPEAELTPPPFKKAKTLPPVGHRSLHRPRKLSEKQRRTFLGEAVKRIQSEAFERSGRYLRRLDTIHEGGNRSRAERWLALAAVAEPLLARLDIATGCLGWLGDDGQFRLNRQTGMAEDAGIHPARLCRLLKALEKAQYTLRKIKRLYRNGKRWVTRVTIYMRPRFFHDLGLGLAHATARTRKAAAYLKKKRHADAATQQTRLDDVARAHERRMSHRKAESRRADLDRQAKHDQRLQSLRSDAAILMELAMAYPGREPDEYRAMLRQRKGQ
ncbi:hypothetical protein ACF8GD_00265 [Pseudomonas putida]|uniref:hypothetical protein n=1 Tax=Pseudomonas putida TaxID=303 RepID=UPI00370A28CE